MGDDTNDDDLGMPWDAFADAIAHDADGRCEERPSSTLLDEGEDLLTDAGAAERFTRRHGQDVRYDHRREQWLLWRQHRWMPDADAAITRLAIEFARTWQREAMDIKDRDRREKAVHFALRLERRDALMNVLKFAKDMKPIANAGDQWDRDPMLFGVMNGTIDLRTGALRDGCRDDLITMRAALPFDTDARCPRWERFLTEVFVEAALVGFVHRSVGMSLTGITAEQCFFMAAGAGANGKGTFTTTLAEALGDYAYVMPFSTVELHQRSPIPNDLAALVGRRFVVASETNDGARLNEARMKALTGCDPLTARFLHSEFFTFRPVAKFWLSVNHKPTVRDDSHGFWRRMRLIPFTRTFAVHPTLARELRAEATGILAWAVRGCLAWQRAGLDPPDIVNNATADYARDSDPLAGFLSEACELEPSAEVRATDLYEHYKTWAHRSGLSERERLTMTAFGLKMSERFQREHRRVGSVYKGISRGDVTAFS